VLVSIAVKKHRSGFSEEDEMFSAVGKPRVQTPPIVENEDTSVNANADGTRKSVHYNFSDPYHPLRMHPVDSKGTVRSVPPEITEGKAKATESEDLNPRPRVATPPAVYLPLPPRAAYCETINSISSLA